MANTVAEGLSRAVGYTRLGAILATCSLVDCIPIEQCSADARERAFGDYSPGRYGWILEDVKPLPDPEPARGALGLWEWDDAAYWKRREDYGPNGDATTPGFWQRDIAQAQTANGTRATTTDPEEIKRSGSES